MRRQVTDRFWTWKDREEFFGEDSPVIVDHENRVRYAVKERLSEGLAPTFTIVEGPSVDEYEELSEDEFDEQAAEGEPALAVGAAAESLPEQPTRGTGWCAPSP